MLDTTSTSVNSALIRARTTIDERGPHAHDRAPLPRSAQERELVARFADAFERGDVEPIVALLAEDAWLTMPPEPTRYGEVLGLEPYPDARLEGLVDGTAGPEARYETHEAVTLAFLTALHRLPPRQRAVLVLRDVLGFSATEVAVMLDTTPTSVNSALIRARATIEEREPRAHDRAPVPRSAQEHELVARFADAFERGEVEPIVALLAEDAWWTMPPEPYGYQGHNAIKQFIAHAFTTRETPRRLIPTRANSQPAFGQYVKDPHTDVGRAVGLLVLTLDGDRISHITRFAATSALPHFGLPRTIPW